MTDKPISFSGAMVRALLAGTKTQTRRVIKPRGHASIFDGSWCDDYVLDPGNAEWRARDVRFAVGDRLYVREHWRVVVEFDGSAPSVLIPGAMPILYEADAPHSMSWVGRFRQGMHMPRWASRITLHVTEVRVQRLQEISEEDALREGVETLYGESWYVPGVTHQRKYQLLWGHINGPGSWEANPFVAAVSFTVEHCNIDQERIG